MQQRALSIISVAAEGYLYQRRVLVSEQIYKKRRMDTMKKEEMIHGLLNAADLLLTQKYNETYSNCVDEALIFSILLALIYSIENMH